MPIRHTFNQINTYTTLGRGGLWFTQKKNNTTVTYTNLITNGNFVGTTGWSYYNSTISAGSNTCTNTIGAVPSNNFAQINETDRFIGVTNKKVYARATALVTNSSCLKLRLDITATGAGAFIKEQNTPTINQWYTLSSIFTLTSGWDTKSVECRVQHHYADITTAANKTMQVKEVMLIDMNADGLTSYDLTQMDALAFIV